MVSFYSGNQTGNVPGYLPPPYYWWEAGAYFGALVNYWFYTGDTSYVDITIQALVHQAGPLGDFMPANQTRDEGNDDQCFWAQTAMMAAEHNFPNPPASDPQYLESVQAVFNEIASRWDPSSCGGGLRWQIFSYNAGYNYKNCIANGCFFDIAARLARYTGNQSYADWAVKTWDWVSAIGLLNENYQTFDGTNDQTNCSSIDHLEWTYNNGIFLHGASVMYNFTNQSTLWKERVDGLLKASSLFFSNNASSKNVMYEYVCEMNDNCDVDELSFKAYLARWMASATKLAPYIYDTVMSYLQPTAIAALAQCQGGSTGTFCGFHWTTGVYDGTTGVGQQMDVLEVLQSNLVTHAQPPLTNSTGGTSKGNPAAGSPTSSTPDLNKTPITTGDKIGAALVTTVLLSMVAACVYTMVN